MKVDLKRYSVETGEENDLNERLENDNLTRQKSNTLAAISYISANDSLATLDEATIIDSQRIRANSG